MMNELTLLYAELDRRANAKFLSMCTNPNIQIVLVEETKKPMFKRCDKCDFLVPAEYDGCLRCEYESSNENGEKT